MSRASYSQVKQKKCSPATTPMSKGEPTDGLPYESNKENTAEKDVYILSHPSGIVKSYPKGCFIMFKYSIRNNRKENGR